MLEQNDESAASRRYLSLRSLTALSDDPVLRLSGMVPWSPSNPAEGRRSYTEPRDTAPHSNLDALTAAASSPHHEPS